MAVKRSVITIVAEAGQSEGLDKARAENYLHCMRQWLRQDTDTEYELITVEQNTGVKTGLFEDVASILANESRVSCSYHVIFGDKFKRGWALNVGAKFAAGQELLFVDADVLVGTDYMERLDRWVSDVSPKHSIGWNRLYRLTETGRYRCLNSIYAGPGFPDREFFGEQDLVHEPRAPLPGGAAGGINYFQRDFFFDSLGGWNETFTQGTGNDNDMVRRALSIEGPLHTMPYDLLHLWHPGKIQGTDNQELWSFTREHPALVTAKIKALGIGGHRPAVYELSGLIGEEG